MSSTGIEVGTDELFTAMPMGEPEVPACAVAPSLRSLHGGREPCSCYTFPHGRTGMVKGEPVSTVANIQI